MELVGIHGPKKWSLIATSLRGRIGKQCRERWHNHLNPDVRKDAWSAEEDALIFQLVEKHGTKWATIAKALNGRTDNSIKNRYYSSLKKFHEQRLQADGVPLPLRCRPGSRKRRLQHTDSMISRRSSIPDTISESSSDDLTTLNIFGEDIVERSPKTVISQRRDSTSSTIPNISHMFTLGGGLFTDAPESADPATGLPTNNGPIHPFFMEPLAVKHVTQQRRLLPLHKVHSQALVQQTINLSKLYQHQMHQQQQQQHQQQQQESSPVTWPSLAAAPHRPVDQQHPAPVTPQKASELLEPLSLVSEYQSLLHVL